MTERFLNNLKEIGTLVQKTKLREFLSNLADSGQKKLESQKNEG